MNDRPDAAELLEAVRRFLAEEAVPALGGHLAYQARVAANVVGIVAREIESAPADLESEWRGLAGLLGVEGEAPGDAAELRAQVEAWNATLCERIRAGEADEDPWRGALMGHLRQTVDQKLRVARG